MAGSYLLLINGVTTLVFCFVTYQVVNSLIVQSQYPSLMGDYSYMVTNSNALPKSKKAVCGIYLNKSVLTHIFRTITVVPIYHCFMLDLMTHWLLHVWFIRQLLISMGERTVIVCESLLCTDMWKQTLAKVLLQDFGVSPFENFFRIV